MSIPDEWLEIDSDQDMLESQAFYELMQVYRFAHFGEVAHDFEEVKKFIRMYHSNPQGK